MIKLNNTFFKIFLLSFCLLTIFAFQKTNYLCIKNTISVFLESVMPSLFPFILFTNILILSDTASLITKFSKKYGYILYAGFIGFLCGYPMGAKATYALYSQGNLSKKQTRFLMSFANNCNPIFIMSTIGLCVLNNITLGLLLLISHYVSAIIICTFNFFYNDIIHENVKNSNSFSKDIDKKLHKSIFEIIDTSIKSTFITLGNILGFILIFNLLFSAIEKILLNFNVSSNIIYIISPLFEVTNGTRLLYLNTDYNFNILIAAISFMLSFSGLSIIFQIYSCIYKSGIKIWHIIKYKFIQGVLSAIITYMLLNICNTNVGRSNILPNFNSASYFLIIASCLFIFSSIIKKVT